MTTRTIRFEEPEDLDSLVKETVDLLREGGLVVYPTDTSYGLACDPMQEHALERLFEAKKRSKDLGVPLIFSDLAQCEAFHEFSELEKILARLFWPGALTLVVTARESVAVHLTGGRNSIAIRVPDHPIPRNIAKELGTPIVGTSANITGGPSPFDISTAMAQLSDDVDLYIDAGPSNITNNSTIIGVEEENGETSNIKVYREGALSINRLTESLRVDSDALRFWTNRVVYADM